MFKKINTIVLIVIISAVLAVYFVFSLYVYPQFYLTIQQTQKALPLITDVTTSYKENLLLGDSFNITITSVNLGGTADIQITSVSFPNFTNNIDDNSNNIIKILRHNFTQNPTFTRINDEVGSEYAGLSRTTLAKYPSIEFYNRPWHTKTFHEAELKVLPPSKGNFVIFVKTVALPHVDNTSHYPTTGIRDQQREFVNAYYFKVM